VSNSQCRVCAVHEDWNAEEGAGNLLGTLYAWQKAGIYHQDRFGTSLQDALDSGKSIAMFHLAGLGTRLAPLPAAECNSKSAVKLPSLIHIGTTATPITILEAVILQTGPFAESRKGRLSVWWGDQVFIPSFYKNPGTHHIEILAKKTEISKELENYGLLIFCNDHDCMQREKLPFHRIIEVMNRGEKDEKEAGMSLGSFSVSSAFLSALLQEFSSELEKKTGRLNTDGDLWQPLTSTCREYCETGRTESTWHRIDSFWERFSSVYSSGLRKFGYLNIGDSYWWDFGQVKLYYQNIMKMLSPSDEGDAMRRFFKAPVHCTAHTGKDALIEGSLLLGSTIGRGMAKNCIIVNSHLGNADLEDSVIIESDISGSIEARNAVAYRLLEEGSLRLEEHEVTSGVVLPPDRYVRMRLLMDRKEKEHWKEPILDNPMSFREIWRALRDVDRKEQERLFYTKLHAPGRSRD
jgi:hypothetical protein